MRNAGFQFLPFRFLTLSSEEEGTKHRKKKKKHVEDDSLETTYEKSGKPKTVQVSACLRDGPMIWTDFSVLTP